MRKQTELSYRIAAADIASPIALVLAMYDTLAGDLLRASEAIRTHRIEQRCAELNHAYVVLAHLESWLDLDQADPLATSLTDFYGYIRAKMLEASIKQSASVLEAAVQLILQVRAAWQHRSGLPSDPVGASPYGSVTTPKMAPRGALSRSA